MLHTKVQAISQLGLEKIFKGFNRIWAWWSYWSCDLDSLNIFVFPPTLKATYEIWLQFAKWLLRKYLKLSNYGKSLVKDQTMTLTFSTHKSSSTHYDNSNYHFEAKIFITFHEILCISICPI